MRGLIACIRLANGPLYTLAVPHQDTMSLYNEAATFLMSNGREGSLQTRVFNASRAKKIKTDPKHIYALVSSTLKYKPFILKIIKKAKLMEVERSLKEPMALLLVHDLLFSKSGRIQMGKTPLKESILRHKTRLTAELTKLKLKHKVKDLADIIDEDDTPVRWFRVNTLKTTVDDVLERFDHLEEVSSIEKIKPGKIYHDKHVPNLFGVSPKERITQSKSYEKGEIIIQDRASCFPAHILNPAPGDVVIDSCAAPGNKTTHLAAHVGPEGSITAFERDSRRSNILKMMVEKAGASDFVRVNVGDFTQAKWDDYTDVTGLVVDPSCSGSGIFGRAHEEENPEESYNDERLQKLSSFQFSIVKHALGFPSARKVVYSTCSIHAQENERVVIDLLNDAQVKKAGWRVANRSRVIPMWPRRGLVEEFKGFPNPEQLAGGCVRALPKIDGGIGFFAVLFERELEDDVLNASEESSKDAAVDDMKGEFEDRGAENDQGGVDHSSGESSQELDIDDVVDQVTPNVAPKVMKQINDKILAMLVDGLTDKLVDGVVDDVVGDAVGTVAGKVVDKVMKEMFVRGEEDEDLEESDDEGDIAHEMDLDEESASEDSSEIFSEWNGFD